MEINSSVLMKTKLVFSCLSELSYFHVFYIYIKINCIRSGQCVDQWFPTLFSSRPIFKSQKCLQPHVGSVWSVTNITPISGKNQALLADTQRGHNLFPSTSTPYNYSCTHHGFAQLYSQSAIFKDLWLVKRIIKPVYIPVRARDWTLHKTENKLKLSNKTQKRDSTETQCSHTLGQQTPTPSVCMCVSLHVCVPCITVYGQVFTVRRGYLSPLQHGGSAFRGHYLLRPA